LVTTGDKYNWNNALPKTGGTMSGNIAMGSNKITNLTAGTANTDAVNKEQLDSLVEVATGTISTSATSTEVVYPGMLINAYAKIGNEYVIVDMVDTGRSVVFSTAQVPTSAVTCTVVYIGEDPVEEAEPYTPVEG